jgi:hypothetical protein
MPNHRQTLAYHIYFFIQLLYAIIQEEIQLEETNRQRRLKFISTSDQSDEVMRVYTY